MLDKQGFRRNIIIFLIVLVFFSFILYFYFDGFFAYNGNKVFRDRQYTCFTYLEENTLYKDQGWCFHPPLYYIVSKFIYDLFDENFIFVMIFLALILNVLLFIITYDIIKKRGNSNIISFIIPLLLYGFVAFIHMLDTLLLFGGILFYLGFYLLFYSENKNKEIIAGVLFAVCTLIYTYLFFMGLFLLFTYFISKTFSIKFNKLRPNIKFSGVDYLMILKLIFPIVIIVLFFSILFPGFLSYSYLAQINAYGSGGEGAEMLGITTNNLANSVKSLYDFIFNFTHDMAIRWGDLLMIVFFIASVYFLLKRRDLISLTFFLFLLGFILTAGEFYKFALILPFFLILVVECMNEKSYRNLFLIIKWFCIIVLFVLFIYPNLKLIYLNHEFSDMAKEVSYPLSFLPEQENILFSTNRLEWYGTEFDYDYDILHPILFDPQGSKHLERYGLVNVSEWFNRGYNKQYSFVVSNLGNYSLIMSAVMTEKNNFIYNAIKSNNGKVDLCYVTLASLEKEHQYGNFELLLFFKNKKQCDDFGNKAMRYYAEQFYSICKKDEFVANTIIKSIFIYNGLGLGAICVNGGGLYYLYTEGKGNLNFDDVRIIYFLIIGISMILLGLYISFIRKSLRMVSLIVIIMILIFGIGLLLYSYDLRHYNKLTLERVVNATMQRPLFFDYGHCYYIENNSLIRFAVMNPCRTDEDCFTGLDDQQDNFSLKCSYDASYPG